MSTKPTSEESKQVIFESVKQGLTSRQIAQRIGKAQTTVCRILRQAGTPLSRKRRGGKQRTIYYCKECNGIIEDRHASSYRYCSISCSAKGRRKEALQKWIDNPIGSPDCIPSPLRNHLLEKHNYKCSKCGWGEKNQWTNRVPVEINHIDGDTTNNRLENLEVLCPNCHSLTSTNGSLNYGKSKRTYFKNLKKQKDG